MDEDIFSHFGAAQGKGSREPSPFAIDSIPPTERIPCPPGHARWQRVAEAPRLFRDIQQCPWFRRRSSRRGSN